MDESKLFELCLNYYNQEFKSTTWNDLDQQTGYGKGGEALRSWFKRERQKRGIPSKDKQQNKEEQKTGIPRIVCFDVETSPWLAYTFNIWEGVSPNNVIEDSILMAWSAKDLNDSYVHTDILTSDEAVDRDDERITRSIWACLNGADILIGHNIKAFDIPYINTRFLKYNLPPLQSFQIIDTLLIARSNFKFASNKLSFLNKSLGIKQKLENCGISLWLKCLDGDKRYLNDMIEYCKGDVMAVEELYYKIRPFIKGHPNIGLYNESDAMVCPNCGSENVITQGYYYTSAGKFESMRCKSCGALSRKKTSVISKVKKKNLLRN